MNPRRIYNNIATLLKNRKPLNSNNYSRRGLNVLLRGAQAMLDKARRALKGIFMITLMKFFLSSSATLERGGYVYR